MNTEELKKLERPSFKNPPLVEVVMGVEYAHGLGIRTLDLADFWSRLGREKFPEYREVPPLEPNLPDGMAVFSFSNIPQMPRYWFESPEKIDLVQVQQDRFVYNWRRPVQNMDDVNCYPRYEDVIKNFFLYHSTFGQFVSQMEIVLPPVSSLQLSYVNLIDVPTDGLLNVGNVFSDIIWQNRTNRVLPKPDGMQQGWFYTVPDRPLKVMCTVQNKNRAHDGKPVLQYEIAVRGPLLDSTEDAMRNWFDEARLWINHSFVDTTSKERHQEWGREK